MSTIELTTKIRELKELKAMPTVEAVEAFIKEEKELYGEMVARV